MKWLPALAGALLVGKALLAGPYDQAIRQAQGVSAKVTANNKQLLDNPTPPPSTQKNQPVDPALQATLLNIENLRSDLLSIGNVPATNVLDTQKSSLTNHLAQAAQGAKPQPASVSKLAEDLTAAVAGNAKLHASHPKLAQYVHAAFNGQHLTATQQQMILDSVQKILKDGGATDEETANVVGDLKTIASETK